METRPAYDATRETAVYLADDATQARPVDRRPVVPEDALTSPRRGRSGAMM
jgi:hypothetical protein